MNCFYKSILGRNSHFFFLFSIFSPWLSNVSEEILFLSRKKKKKILSNKRKQDYTEIHVSKVYALLTRMLYHCIKFLLTISWDDLKEIKCKVTYEACNIFAVYFFTNPQNLPGLKAFYNLNQLWADQLKISNLDQNK